MSLCICKPWRGYHKAECPCQAAYERIKATKITGHDYALAYMLLADGYEQMSAKYRYVGKDTFGGMQGLTRSAFAAFRKIRTP